MVAVLLEKGADPNVQGRDGSRAFSAAVVNEDWESARLLLEHGADPEGRNQWNHTALEYAREAGPEQLHRFESLVEYTQARE